MGQGTTFSEEFLKYAGKNQKLKTKKNKLIREFCLKYPDIRLSIDNKYDSKTFRSINGFVISEFDCEMFDVDQREFINDLFCFEKFLPYIIRELFDDFNDDFTTDMILEKLDFYSIKLKEVCVS